MAKSKKKNKIVACPDANTHAIERCKYLKRKAEIMQKKYEEMLEKYRKMNEQPVKKESSENVEKES